MDEPSFTSNPCTFLCLFSLIDRLLSRHCYRPSQAQTERLQFLPHIRVVNNMTMVDDLFLHDGIMPVVLAAAVVIIGCLAWQVYRLSSRQNALDRDQKSERGHLRMLERRFEDSRVQDHGQALTWLEDNYERVNNIFLPHRDSPVLTTTDLQTSGRITRFLNTRRESWKKAADERISTTCLSQLFMCPAGCEDA